jgi:hypothetical protein
MKTRARDKHRRVTRRLGYAEAFGALTGAVA